MQAKECTTKITQEKVAHTISSTGKCDTAAKAADKSASLNKRRSEKTDEVPKDFSNGGFQRP